MKRILLFFLVTTLSFVSYSQKKQSKTGNAENDLNVALSQARQFSPNGIIRCASTEYNNFRKAQGRAVSDQVFEEWLAPKIQEIKRLRQARMLPSVIRIPVVVHVIHNGDPIGTGENIADGQVLSQIQVFNEDFRKLSGTPGDGAGVDTTIEFCLAVVDPNGNPTNGIDRVQLASASYTSMGAVNTAKSATIWDPTRYLNMWTFRFGGGLSTILGFAQFPSGSGLAGMGTDPCIDDLGGGDATTDGVVCNFNTWGSRTIFPGGSYGGTQYDKGRTMTHEVGHMLGLRHTWGDGDCTVDDFCADTPNCTGDFYAGPPCNSPIQCGNPRQIQNYMDYSDDGCMNIFTQDQKDRMLAVMMNSPRRDDLLYSNVCDAIPNSPYIQFKREACIDRQPKSVIEGNGCSYTEFTIPLSIDRAPSQNATVTFSLDVMSEANMNDIEIVTPSVIFNAGSTADQNLVFRVLNDDFVESNEELMITYTISTTGNALSNPKGNTYSLIIINDDSPLSTTIVGQQVFYDGFESYADFTVGNVGGWTTYDLDGDPTYTDDTYDFPNEGYTGSFIIYNPSATTPSSAGSGYDAHTGNKGYYCHNESVAPYANNDWAITPQISLGANSQLSFWAQSLTDNYNGGERFNVLVSTTNTATGSFTKISANPYTVPPLAWTEYTFDLSAYDNQNIYIAIQCVSSDEFVFMLDDVEVISDVTYTAQTAVDVASPGENSLNGAGSASFVDAAVLGKIIAGITINDTSNYGCTTAAVSRAGTGALQYGSSTNPVDFAMSKQFTITPTNILNGSSTITFYFTEAEIAGWEAATGNNRSLLHVVKDNGSDEVQPCAIGAFGTDITLTATFTTGIDGVFSFARQESLGTDSFELNGVSVYPNPNNGEFTLSLNSTTGKVNVGVYDARGRLILGKTISNTGIITETINLNNVQSGVYLITIQDGNRKTTKKIVVQ